MWGSYPVELYRIAGVGSIVVGFYILATGRASISGAHFDGPSAFVYGILVLFLGGYFMYKGFWNEGSKK